MSNTKLAALNRRGNKKLVKIRMVNAHDAGVLFNASITDSLQSDLPDAAYEVRAIDAVSPVTPGKDISRFYRTIVIQAPATHELIQPQVSIDGTNFVDVPVGWTNQINAGAVDTALAVNTPEILAISLPAPGIRVRLSATLAAASDFIVTVMLTDSSERADIGRA